MLTGWDLGIWIGILNGILLGLLAAALLGWLRDRGKWYWWRLKDWWDFRQGRRRKK